MEMRMEITQDGKSSWTSRATWLPDEVALVDSGLVATDLCDHPVVVPLDENGLIGATRCEECRAWLKVMRGGGGFSINASPGHICDDMSYRIRRAAAPVLRLFLPAIGCCHKCRVPWSFIESHSTQFTKGSGCFPLCENCWSPLSPEERLPFYQELWDEWQTEGGNRHEWEDIETAVLAGM